MWISFQSIYSPQSTLKLCVCMEHLSHFRPLGQQTNMTDEQMSDVRQGYPPPLHGLRVVLSILSFSQEVRKHQRFERSGSGRSWVTERVHHTEISPVSDGAEGTWAQASGWVQTVHSDHAWERSALWEIINSRWCSDLENVFHKMFNMRNTGENLTWLLPYRDEVSPEDKKVKIQLKNEGTCPNPMS